MIPHQLFPVEPWRVREAALDLDLLQPSPAQERAKGQLREGFRYVRHTPELAVPLALGAVAEQGLPLLEPGVP